jgi:hypothetical protein
MRLALGRRPALIFGAWTVAGVFFASQLYFLYPITSGGREISFSRALLVNLPFYWLWALLTLIFSPLALFLLFVLPKKEPAPGTSHSAKKKSEQEALYEVPKKHH